MPFVLDASATAAFLLADEESPSAGLLLELLLHQRAIVPTVWWFEIRNLLLTAERRKRIDTDEADRLLVNLSRYPIDIDTLPDGNDVLRTARSRNLTLYDAPYVQLAARLDLPLATLDRGMAAAAAAEGVPLLLGAA